MEYLTYLVEFVFEIVCMNDSGVFQSLVGFCQICFDCWT